MATYISFQPSDYFNTKLYTGNGSTNAITGVGFQPDMTWIKTRSNTSNHQMHDAVRTQSYYYSRPNSTAAQITSNSTTVTAFDSDGFTLGNDGVINENTYTYASWNWKAGTTTGIDTTGSTITPTAYSFNATAGISIVKYTGNDTAGATVPHGLGVAPAMVIVKTLGGSNSWVVYHKSMGGTKYMYLDTTAAEDTNTTRWNDTDPTAVNVVLGSGGNTNGSGGDSPIMMYSFAEKSGFSSFGSYTGNGNADGSFIYTGFRPALVITKYASGGGTGGWNIQDNKRNTYNPVTTILSANTDGADSTSSGNAMDFLSNGFKWRANYSDGNTSGGVFIYAAFAEFPLVSSNDIPTVANN